MPSVVTPPPAVFFSHTFIRRLCLFGAHVIARVLRFSLLFSSGPWIAGGERTSEHRLGSRLCWGRATKSSTRLEATPRARRPYLVSKVLSLICISYFLHTTAHSTFTGAHVQNLIAEPQIATWRSAADGAFRERRTARWDDCCPFASAMKIRSVRSVRLFDCCSTRAYSLGAGDNSVSTVNGRRQSRELHSDLIEGLSAAANWRH